MINETLSYFTGLNLALNRATHVVKTDIYFYGLANLFSFLCPSSVESHDLKLGESICSLALID